MKSITVEIEEMRQMTAAELAVRYEALWGRPARSKHRQHLWRRCAWTLQEGRLGGLSKKATNQLEEIIGEMDLPLGDEPDRVRGRIRANASDPAVGTTLVRPYKGQEIRVDVLRNGFDWDGVVYGSLSAVARAVTGSAWNGRLFFGLTKRSSKK